MVGKVGHGYDTVGLTQSYYYIYDGMVRERDHRRQDHPVNFRSYKKREGKYHYNPEVKWWEVAVENPARVLGQKDEDFILTQSSTLLTGFK